RARIRPGGGALLLPDRVRRGAPEEGTRLRGSKGRRHPADAVSHRLQRRQADNYGDQADPVRGAEMRLVESIEPLAAERIQGAKPQAAQFAFMRILPSTFASCAALMTVQMAPQLTPSSASIIVLTRCSPHPMRIAVTRCSSGTGLLSTS